MSIWSSVTHWIGADICRGPENHYRPNLLQNGSSVAVSSCGTILPDHAGVVELADTRDSKSRGINFPCGFESRLRYLLHVAHGVPGGKPTSGPKRSGEWISTQL